MYADHTPMSDAMYNQPWKSVQSPQYHRGMKPSALKSPLTKPSIRTPHERIVDTRMSILDWAGCITNPAVGNSRKIPGRVARCSRVEERL